MLTGPNLQLYRALEAELAPGFGQVALQVSGGISGLPDVLACRAARLPSVILGRALYEGRISLEEALSAC
jgi:phosphoribosylformimino-5-aminoimidazole carboxamide ribotide isomerase